MYAHPRRNLGKEFKSNAEPALKSVISKGQCEESLLLAAKYGLYTNDDSYEFLKKNFRSGAIVYDAQFKAPSSRGPPHPALLTHTGAPHAGNMSIPTAYFY